MNIDETIRAAKKSIEKCEKLYCTEIECIKLAKLTKELINYIENILDDDRR